MLICTAAGREGINLQSSRILFNFDLPWNPMDVEQRIGRIHRYGQKNTAQVYNLVLSDTIEGKIFLILTDKLMEIARTLGKIDKHGNVTEDLRAQILGQLSERLSYDQLYRDALSDPELKRTHQELEAAMSNANEARKVVYELFQDLDGFSIDDYKPLSDIDRSKARILTFIQSASVAESGSYRPIDEHLFALSFDGLSEERIFTLNRDLAQLDDTVELLGIDHPVMNHLLQKWRNAPPELAGVAVKMNLDKKAVLTLWSIQAFGKTSDSGAYVIPIAVDSDGKRIPTVEKQYQSCFSTSSSQPVFIEEERLRLMAEFIEPTLQRELRHRGIATPEKGYSADLICWIEMK